MKKTSLVLLLLAAVYCRASTISVKADGTGAYPTIQAAVDAAIDGDVINLQRGSYTGAGNRDIDLRGKAITVKGATGNPADCIINCQGTIAAPHRVFIFQNGETAQSKLKHITITGGYVRGDEGWDSYGGGILIIGSSPTINNCIIRDNYAQDCGGGIALCEGSTVTMLDCYIWRNQAAMRGGGVACLNSGLVIRTSTIDANNGHRDGGGIYCRPEGMDLNVKIKDCLITHNRATGGEGGGVSCTGICSIERSVIAQNIALGGGGMSISSSTPTVKNCTIVGNQATSSYGGGIALSLMEASIENCIIWNNTAADGDQIGIFSWSGLYDGPPDQGLYSTLNLSYNDIQGGPPGDL